MKNNNKYKIIKFILFIYFSFLSVSAISKDVSYIENFVHNHYMPNKYNFNGNVFIVLERNFDSVELSSFAFIMDRYTNLLSNYLDSDHKIRYIKDVGSIEKAIDGFYKSIDISNLVRIDSATSCFFDLFLESPGDDKADGLIIFDPSKPGYDEFRCILNAFFVFYGFDDLIYLKNEEVSEEVIQILLLSKTYECSKKEINLRKSCLSESIREIGLDLINE